VNKLSGKVGLCVFMLSINMKCSLYIQA